MTLVFVLEENILIRIYNLRLGLLLRHGHRLLSGLNEPFDLLFVLMIQAEQVVLEAILFIVEEEIVKARIAAPG